MLKFGRAGKDSVPHVREVGFKKHMIRSQIEEDVVPSALDDSLAGAVKS